MIGQSQKIKVTDIFGGTFPSFTDAGVILQLKIGIA
jgi:hypothetical protein